MSLYFHLPSRDRGPLFQLHGHYYFVTAAIFLLVLQIPNLDSGSEEETKSPFGKLFIVTIAKILFNGI